MAQWNPRALLQSAGRLLRVRGMTVSRWMLVAFAFVGVNAGLLFVAHELLTLPILAATVIAGEASTLLRFVANDRWVFGHSRPTLRRCWQFHLTVLASFAVWAGITAGLSAIGVPYLLASVVGNASTVAWGLSTSLLWVWRPAPQAVRLP